MNRRDFTRTCLSCITFAGFPAIMSSCQSTHYAAGTMESNGISVMKSEFTYLKKDQPLFRPYIIIRNDALEFPIYLYRFSDTEYSAVLMKCSHQGNELSASGDHLTCSAHGSEFTNKGTVAQGPAEKDLRRFNVDVAGEKILINLSA